MKILINMLALLISAIALSAALTTTHTHQKHLISMQTEVTASFQQQLEEAVEKSNAILREELTERLDLILAELNHPPSDLSLDPAVELIARNSNLQAWTQAAKSDPETEKLLQRGIEVVLLKHMAAELDRTDWSERLSHKNIQKALRNAANASMLQGIKNHQSPVDISELNGVDEKIAHILKELEGVNTFRSDNPLVKQMVELGDAAVAPLLSQLQNTKEWAQKRAITQTLEKLLDENDEDLILEQFTKHGHFAALIKKYQFAAAEEELINKITHPRHGRVENDVIDAALRMNADRSIPLLIDLVRNGQHVSYAAEQLAAEGIDITEPLKIASMRADSYWDQARLVNLCLEREMKEGYELALKVLRSDHEHADHSKKIVYDSIRKYTGINGSYEEVADWLAQNL